MLLYHILMQLSVFRCVCKIAKSVCWLCPVSESVCLSICMEHLSSHWMDLLDIWVFFENYWEKSGFVKIWQE